MMRNTRAASSKSVEQAASSKSPVERAESNMSLDEVNFLKDKINEKELLLREQAAALAAREAEFEEEKQRFVPPQETTTMLENILKTIHKDLASLKALPEQFGSLQEQVHTLQNTARTVTASAYQPTSQRIYSPPNSPASMEPPPIRLKDVADSIPRYDGQRMSVFQFSKACERALDLIPVSQESYLIQLIMSKLVGHAYTAVEGSRFNSVASLTRKLKMVFGPNKSLNQYKGELANAFMKPNENILDYIARIKELKTAIIDGEYELHRRLDDQTLDDIDTDVLESFINGLPSDLLIRVKLEGFEDLDDAFMKAIQMSKTIDSEALRRKPPFSTKPQNAPSPRQDAHHPRFTESAHSSNHQPSYQILKRPPGPFIKPLIPGQPGPNAPVGTFCRYVTSQTP